MLSRSLLLLLLLALPAPAADALSLRQWCIEATTVVAATPLDPVEPTRFKVTRVLRGKAKVGDLIAPAGLATLNLRTFDEPDLAGDGKPRPRRVEQALLFLADGAARPGLWLCTDDGRVMALDEMGAPQLRPSRWPVLFERVRVDLATVDRLRAMRRVADPGRKTRALAEWIERHRAELSTPPPLHPDDEAPVGWEGLHVALFDWIFETDDPACAWSAVKLYARLHGGDLLRPRNGVFATAEGLAYLRRQVRDDNALPGDRARAVALLGGRPEALDDLLPLLGDRDPALRMAAVLAIGRMARPERAIDPLIAAYRSAAPGPLRDELGWVVCGLVSASRWKALSGNPAGVAVALRELERGPDHIGFWMHVRSEGSGLAEQPTLVMEKLNNFGFVMETKRLPLEVTFLPRPWKDGWGEVPLPAKVSLAGLQPNTNYRFRVEGVIGKDRAAWKSEPHKFKTANGPAGPDSPYMRGGRRSFR